MKAKKPTWITVIGVLGIVFGSFGIVGALQLAVTPTILKAQMQMFHGMEKMARQQAQRPRDPRDLPRRPRAAPPPEVFRILEQFLEMPAWFAAWCIVSGLVGAGLCTFYLIAAIRILQVKRNGPRLFYFAAGSTIAWAAVDSAVALSTGKIWGVSMLVGNVFGAVVDVVLLVIVATSDKRIFATWPREPVDEVQVVEEPSAAGAPQFYEPVYDDLPGQRE